MPRRYRKKKNFEFSYVSNLSKCTVSLLTKLNIFLCLNLFRYEKSIPLIHGLVTWLRKTFAQISTGELMASKLVLRLNNLNELTYANVESNDRYDIGVKLERLIFKCTYNGKPCNMEDFHLYQHPTYINCYTFQPAKDSMNTEILTGPRMGLSIILHSEAKIISGYDEMDNSGNTNSIKVAIHPPNTLPFVKNYGIDLTPGHSTSVSLVMKRFERLGKPYSQCKEQELFLLDSREFLSTSGFCREKCIAEAIQKHCNCTSTMFEDILSHAKYDYCLKIGFNDNFETMNAKTSCEYDFMHSLRGLSCSQCSSDCLEIKYDFQITMADWPTQEAAQTFINARLPPLSCENPFKYYLSRLLNNSKVNPTNLKEYEKCPIRSSDNDTLLPFSLVSIKKFLKRPGDILSVLPANFNETYKYQMHDPDMYADMTEANYIKSRWVWDSFYRLNVYFRESTVEQHIQVASFSFADLWSGIGGILGLWLGISVMTIIEIISFFANLMTIFCKKKNPVSENSNTFDTCKGTDK